MKIQFSRQIFEKLKYQVSSKTVQWEADFFADDMTKLIVASRNFPSFPKTIG
jgi:CYTH domain-containing protein